MYAHLALTAQWVGGGNCGLVAVAVAGGSGYVLAGYRRRLGAVLWRGQEAAGAKLPKPLTPLTALGKKNTLRVGIVPVFMHACVHVLCRDSETFFCF